MEIVLYGKGRDDLFVRQMVATLESQYSTLFFGNHVLTSNGKEPSLLVLEESKELTVSSKDSLIILRERANIANLKLLNSQIPVLVYSNHQRQIEWLSKLGYRAITCGLLEKDTLNFSSLGVDSSMITLQRYLQCFRKTVEPMDIPVFHPKEFSPFLLLCLTAISLFLESPTELELNFRNAKNWQSYL